MLCASSSFASAMAMASSSPVSRLVGFNNRTPLRYDHEQRLRRCSWTGIDKKTNPFPRIKTASAYPVFLNQLNKDSERLRVFKEVTMPARKMFTLEISTESKDSEVSIAKALLYIAAEDEASSAYNRELDAESVRKEWEVVGDQADLSGLGMDAQTLMTDRESLKDQSDTIETERSDMIETDSEALLQIGGKSISEWLSELDAIAKEVEVELVERDIGCHLFQVLDAVNAVLFDWRGFKRIKNTDLDPECFYLHSVLNRRCSTAFLLSVIYIEVCTRLGVPIVGSRVGEDFLIWPKLDYPEELFKGSSGKSLFSIVNGNCVDDPATMASDLTAKSLEGLEIATHRDVIGIALANLVRLHWKLATKSSPGLRLTSPLNPFDDSISIKDHPPFVRPQELRLAIAALERLLILYPCNWAFRRDLGLMLYYARLYREATAELSICIAFTSDEDEAELLERFVRKLHVFRGYNALLKSPVGSDRLTIP